MADNDTFGSRLAFVMIVRGIRAVDIVENQGIEKSHLSHILSGDRLPSFQTLCSLIKAVEPVDANWLVTGKPTRAKRRTK